MVTFLEVFINILDHIFLISAIIVVIALVIIVTTKRFDNIKKNEV